MKSTKDKKRRKARAAKPAIAKPAPPPPPPGDAEGVVHTRDEAALALGVSTRTLAQWLTDPTFPGKAGQPGCRDGVFPLAAIRAWHAATHGANSADVVVDAELLEAKKRKAITDSDRAHVALEREIGSIVDADEVAAFLARVVASTKSALEDAAERAESRLPRSIGAAGRKAVREAIEDSHRVALDSLAELLAGDGDDDDEITPDQAE